MLPRGKSRKKGALTFQGPLLTGSSRIPLAPRMMHKVDRGHHLPLCLPVPHRCAAGPRGPPSSPCLCASALSSWAFVPLCFFLPAGVPGQTSACPRLPAGSTGGSRAGEASAAWGSSALGARSFRSIPIPMTKGRGQSRCSFASHNSSLHTELPFEAAPYPETGFPLVRSFPFHHFQPHDPQRPDVHFGAVGFASHHFWCHPAGSAHPGAALAALRTELSTEAKVS